MRVAFLNRPEDSPGSAAEQEDGVERSLLAMERVSLIFERYLKAILSNGMIHA